MGEEARTMKSVAIGKSFSAIALGVVLASCSSGPSVEVGEKEGAGAGSSGAGEVWTGHLEGVVLKGASSTTTLSLVTTDQVTLAFQTRSASSLTGTVVFGSGSPPPVDPAVVPPVYLADRQINQGFPFSMHEGTLSGTRAQFLLYQSDQYGPWCALQTPTLCPDASNPDAGVYQCAPCGTCNAFENPICGICVPGAMCQCTATGCSVVPDVLQVYFDLTFQGDAANGTVLGVNDAPPSYAAIPVNVRLTRVQ
jgi:hypothetical protein